MSQKTKMLSIKHSGAPVYLGEDSGNSVFSCNPNKIMDWLCDGYRTRFNQHRSNRKKYDNQGSLIPIGDYSVDIKDSQARKLFSYLSAMPGNIISATERKENTEWFSAVKRKSSSGGRMPRFKSRKLWDQQFVCWQRGLSFHRTGKKTGVIIIGGMNPKGRRKPGHKARWKLTVRVRLTQNIRDFTSVLVNWSRKTIVFVNAPTPIEKSENFDPEAIIGCDRGGVIPLTTSNGDMLSPNKEKLEKLKSKEKYHQKQLGKARSRAEKRGGRNAKRKVMKGNRYQKHKAQAAKYAKKAKDHINGWAQEITTELIKNFGTIALEDLNIQEMTRNGGSRKKGMNRSFLASSPSTIARLLEYKAIINGNTLAYIPAHFTSQRCNNCGHTHKENRESQAFFKCRRCDHEDNADINAARNIRDYFVNWIFEGTDLPAYSGTIGSGEIIRPKMSKDMVNQLYQGRFDDAANPPKKVPLERGAFAPNSTGSLGIPRL